MNESYISEFLFDVLELKMDDCSGIALRTHRYDTKEINFKKGVDPSAYLIAPVMFKGHEITIKKQMNNLTRVTMKNVPFNIPDEEIINLCKVYGEPLKNKVHYERPSRNTRGIHGSTRSVEMKLTPGKQFENYYWTKAAGLQFCMLAKYSSVVTALGEQTCARGVEMARPVRA